MGLMTELVTEFQSRMFWVAILEIKILRLSIKVTNFIKFPFKNKRKGKKEIRTRGRASRWRWLRNSALHHQITNAQVITMYNKSAERAATKSEFKRKYVSQDEFSNSSLLARMHCVQPECTSPRTIADSRRRMSDTMHLFKTSNFIGSSYYAHVFFFRARVHCWCLFYCFLSHSCEAF